MLEAILRTKLFIPPIRPNLVPRQRLIERLNQGLQLGHKLTLISAPAGFGKTTLASEWLAGCDRPSAWLSLDERDNEPARFLTYLVAALQTIAPDIGEAALGMLHSPQPPPTESILTALLNEITAVPDSFILVLDDYHLIDAQAVDASTSVDGALTFLLEHLPPQMHLMIATRDDPNLPLARLRAQDKLSELRAADLRFTSSEAAAFLNQVMGLDLSAAEVTVLETRTEGWITGLQLAALSMRGREDVTGFIKAFAGDNRYVVDYLVEEVLRRQLEHVRSFLLRTSILDRLSGPLCDALCFSIPETAGRSEGTAAGGAADGRHMLELLDRGNLFVVPLDDKRHWYRYHHLFADVLHAHLMEEQLDLIPLLHRRASMWYEQNDLPEESIRHALAAGDFERAADLAELVWPAWSGSFQSITWLGWVKTVPQDLVRARPVLCVAYAWAFLNSGDLEAAEARLLDAERWLEPAEETSERLRVPATEMVVVDNEQFQLLPASLATARAYHAQAVGNIPGTVKYARRVLDLLPEGYPQWRGDATALLGLAYWTSGDLETAHQTLSDGFARMTIHEVIIGTFVLADIKMTLGHLHEAVTACQQSLRLAVDIGEPLGTEDVYTGISKLHREQGDLQAAAQALFLGRTLGEQVELPDWQYRWCIAQARLKQSLGDLDDALDLLDEAQRLYVRTPLPDLQPIAALKTRIWIAQGRLAEVQGWARERGLSVDDKLSFLHEFEHITLARVLIAHYKDGRVDRSIHEAAFLLQRLLEAAQEGGRMGSVIEILLLLALTHQAQNKLPPALDYLERALTLAEPQGYVQIFVDEGPQLASLLYKALSQGNAPDYSRQLLAAFPTAGQQQAAQLGSHSEFLDALSEREIEVLQLVAEGLTNQEIAVRLYLSLHTVKVHARNIYGKLGVKNRTQAVAKGRALGILAAA